MAAKHRSHGMPVGDEATIAALAEETRTDEAVVQSLYAQELAALEAESSIKNFIGVIAARRVKQRLTAHHQHTRAVSPRAQRRSRAA